MGKTVAIWIAALLAADAFAAVGERVEAPVENGGVQRLNVLAGGYFFHPGHIVVKANRPVEMVISKEPGFAPHTFALRIPGEQIDLDQELDAAPKTIRFTIRQPGRYEFYCSKRLLFFVSHREKGMEGVIEVVE